jgi:ABC-2 type transport system ATP-binding protein
VLRGAGHHVEPDQRGGVTVDATAEQVGRLAAASGQVLLELRDGAAAGLEDLFFSLTSQHRPDAGEQAA